MLDSVYDLPKTAKTLEYSIYHFVIRILQSKYNF